MAGERSIVALGFQFVSADAAQAWVHDYCNAINKRLDKLANYSINPNIALATYFMCAKTNEEARERAYGLTFFQFALRHYAPGPDKHMTLKAGHLSIWGEHQKWKADNGDAVAAALEGGLAGTNETISRTFGTIASSNV